MTLHGIQPDLFEDIERERDVLDGVACSNKLALALAAQAGVAAERLYYVPYGVPMPSSPTLAADAVAHAVERRLRIAYVGRLEQWQKRVLELPPICDELVRCGVDFELLVAGSGPDEVTLRQQLAGHVAAGRVIWLGHVPASDVAERVYRRADVLINPSLWETGPIVVWEAMAHGVAVVTSRYVGCGLEGALQDDHNCLMYPIGDVTRAATAIASLTDRQRRQRLVDGGRTLVRTRYSIAASVDAWDRAIRAVLSQPPMPIPTQLRRDVQPSGRLDRWLGVRYGEMVRRALGVRFAHSEPGGEWPHSYGTKAIDDEAFWARAKALDACESLAEQRP